jgi:hypothetical protein
MKKLIITLSLLAFFFVAPMFLLAQTPPHPNGGGGPGGGNTPVGGAAPIDGGLTIMMVLGAAYASKKIFQQQK